MNILREVYLLYMCYQGKTMTGGVKTPTHMQSVWRMETDGYPKLSLHEECTLETSENDKSGIGSMGWKEAWYAWEWGVALPPTKLGKQEEDEDKDDDDWGIWLEVKIMEGWETAEERGGRGRQSSCPNEWLRECLKVALGLEW